MDVSTYSIVLLVHVVGAVAWFASVIAAEVLGARARQRGDIESAVVFARDHALFTRVVALPGALLLLLSGGWLMQDGGRSFDDSWWIGAGLGIWLVAFGGSTMLRGPRLSRTVAAASADPIDEEDVRWRLRQVLLIGRGELLLLTVALAVMVLQPS